MASNAIEIRRLDGTQAREQLDALAAVLHDCVAGGASVNYLEPFSHDDARRAFDGFVADVEHGRRVLLAAFAGAELVGTVQVILPVQPNQPHRADIGKLLVHRSARGHGVAQLLMERAEVEARVEGRTLLVLDTVTGSTADRLYRRLGWNELGVVPDYALYPDGRFCDATFFWKRIPTEKP
jgi:GNAT superfamily N-acetyltransferase